MATPTPTPLRVCEQIVSKSGVATLLQLSDLHLHASAALRGAPGHRGFMDDLERALRAQKEPFDLVVVTGDVIHAGEIWSRSWTKAMTLAKRAVMEVCDIVGVKPDQGGLIVIPGNHDLRQWGILPRRKLATLFREEFGTYFAHSYYPHLGLLIACFDSNQQVRLWLMDFAKGMAATAQCDLVLKEIEDLAKTRGLEQYRDGARRAFRLALIHHHLMAIPTDDFAADTKKLVGAPSLMLLRNAGSFLQRLLKDDYRLVLHGHLHTHGYWLPQTFFEGEDSPRWLELISCGWAGVSSADNVRTFNVLKVHDTGLVESKRVEFRASEIEPMPSEQKMASYNLVRTRAWDHREHPPGAVVCDTYSQRWDVILPEGDVVVTEVIRGLRGDGAQVGEMTVYKEALGLTQVEFSAEYLGPNRRPIPYERFAELVPGGEVPRIGFKLKFSPPLGEEPGKKVDILLRSTIFGGIASSQEDQRYARVASRQMGKEEVYHVVARACGRLVVNVRFFSNAAELVPDAVDLRVYDPSVRAAPSEEGSDHITWDYWSSDRESGTVFDLPSVPEATLSVYRPQPGHGYALEWDLPEFEAIADREALLNQRLWLLRLGDDPQALAAVGKFLGELKQYVQTHAGLVGAADPRLGVHLYAFDPALAQMVSTQRDTFPSDTLPKRIAYGRDCIGTAFRSWFPLSFDRGEAQGHLPLFDQMPDDVNYLLAWPLWRADQSKSTGTTPEPIDFAPVGVVALASGTAGGKLGQILGNEEKTTRLYQHIATQWRKCQGEAGWVTAEGG